MKRLFFTIAMVWAALSAQAKYGYVTNGLVAHFDAIDNVGNGVHNIGSAAWTNLLGGAAVQVLNTTWAESSRLNVPISAAGGTLAKSSLLDWTEDDPDRTVEVVAEYKDTCATGVLLMGTTASRIAIGRFNGNRWIVSTVQTNIVTNSIGADFGAISVGYRKGMVQYDRIFGNGSPESVDSTSSRNSWSGANDNVYVGKRASGSGMIGSIYSVRIYNRLLTEDEARQNAQTDYVRFKTKSAVTYVVPTGTVDEAVSAAPYSSWASAATTINAAAVATATNGTVNILSGTYADNRFMTEHSLVMRAVASTDSDAAPGTVTFGSTVSTFDDNLAEADENRRQLTLAYGTFIPSPSAQNAFLEYCHGNWGGNARNTLIVTGSNTLFNCGTRNFYAGYTTKNSLTKIADQALFKCGSMLVGHLHNASGAQVVVEDGGKVEIVNNLQVGNVYKNCKLTIDDGNLTAGYIYFDNTSPTFTKSGAQDTWATNDTEIVIAGEEPSLFAKIVMNFNGNAKLTFDLSNLSAIGYANAPVRARTVGFNAASTIALAGTNEFKATLAAADVHHLRIPIVEGTNVLNLTAEKLEEINAPLAGSEFSIIRRGNVLKIAYDDGTPPEVVLVADSAAGSVPTWPYDEPETALHTLTEGVNVAAPNGAVRVLSGFYVPENVSDGYCFTNSAKIYAVADFSDDPEPGVMVITNRIFGGVMRDNNNPYDPRINSFNFYGGTCVFMPSTSGNFFTEYVPAGAYGKWANIHITFSGDRTTLIATNGIANYIGYPHRGMLFKVTDGATANFGASIVIGGLSTGVDNTLYLDDGAYMKCNSRVLVSGEGVNSRIVISNATLKTWSLYASKARNFASRSVILLAGESPKVEASFTSGDITINSNAELRVNMAEAPVRGYANIPLKAWTFKVAAGGSVALEGVNELIARMRAEGVTYTSFTLATASRGVGYCEVDEGVLDATRRTLPRGCDLYAAGANFKLNIDLRKHGFLLTANGDSSGGETGPVRIVVRPEEDALYFALDKFRKLTAEQRARGVELLFRPGVYRTDGITLTEADSGTEESPVIWRAEQPGTVKFVTYKDIPTSSFRPWKDGILVAPINDVYLDRMSDQYYKIYESSSLQVTHLIVDNKMMTPAQWPNEGWTNIAFFVDAGTMTSNGNTTITPTGERRGGTFGYSGDRPERWLNETNYWLEGYWCYDWSLTCIAVKSINVVSNTITLNAQHAYGVRQGNPSPRRWRARHLLSELDVPGEYYVDTVGKKLYLMPPEGFDAATSKVSISSVDVSDLTVNGAHDIVFENLDFAEGWSRLVMLNQCRRIRISGCRFYAGHTNGITLDGCSDCEVTGCDFHDLGSGGIALKNDDVLTLKPSNNLIEDCLFRYCSLLQLTYAPSINGTDCVGATIRHCEITDQPHIGVVINGNDMLFEYNIISNVCYAADDASGYYGGRRPACQGNEIRHCLLKDIRTRLDKKAGMCGIYLDDGQNGHYVHHTIFVNAGTTSVKDNGDTGHAGAMYTNAGFSNVCENCIFVDCVQAISCYQQSNAAWQNELEKGLKNDGAYWSLGKLGGLGFFTNLESSVHQLYVSKYPMLNNWLEVYKPVELRENLGRNNVAIDCYKLNNPNHGGWNLDSTNITLGPDEDPGFVDREHFNYALRPDSVIYQKLPSFTPIEFDKIGLLHQR